MAGIQYLELLEIELEEDTVAPKMMEQVMLDEKVVAVDDGKLVVFEPALVVPELMRFENFVEEHLVQLEYVLVEVDFVLEGQKMAVVVVEEEFAVMVQEQDEANFLEEAYFGDNLVDLLDGFEQLVDILILDNLVCSEVDIVPLDFVVDNLVVVDFDQAKLAFVDYSAEDSMEAVVEPFHSVAAAG